MKIKYINTASKKKKYTTPEIAVIGLDKEISLAMESDPNPYGEPEWTQNNSAPQFDPLKTNLG